MKQLEHDFKGNALEELFEGLGVAGLSRPFLPDDCDRMDCPWPEVISAFPCERSRVANGTA